MYFPHFCGLFPNLTPYNWNELRNTFGTICNVIYFIRRWPNTVQRPLYVPAAIHPMLFIGDALAVSSVTAARHVARHSISWMAPHWPGFIISTNGRLMQTASAEACRCELPRGNVVST